MMETSREGEKVIGAPESYGVKRVSEAQGRRGVQERCGVRGIPGYDAPGY